VPINYPDYNEIVDRTRADVAQMLPDLDPTVFGSFIRAITDSQSGRAFDIVLLFQQLTKQLFPQTAEGEYLERWAEYEGLSRNPATEATGNITVVGTVGTVIPLGTQFSHSSGNLYTVDSDATISAQVLSILSITRSGQTATVTTSTDHNLASNIDVTIAGANEAEYNGTYTITVTDTDTFTYTVTGTPATPATGTITASANVASVTITSVLVGQDQNLSSGAKTTVVTPIAGLEPSAYVQFDGLTGGTDVETDTELLVRVLQSRSNPVTNFNVAAIEKVCLAVPGVTRVKVKRITPDVGDVTILFVRDNDANIIPDAGEVTTVKDAILEITPVNTDESSVVVTAPTPVTTNYTFTSITPNTSTMQNALQESLAAFYRDGVTFETTITEDKYRSAIIDTVDPSTGDTLTAFTLSSPAADIVITTDEIGILGDVFF
jgi:uncharacterized phage protein gp47/JayE